MDFEGADIAGASFQKSNLSCAALARARAVAAVFLDADLSSVDFRGAWLDQAVFGGARLEGADMRGARGFVVDSSLTRQTQFSSRAQWSDCLPRSGSCNWLPWRGHWSLRSEVQRRGSVDPWSKLRTVYTGPKFFYHLLFLVAFVLPLVLNAVSWKSANRAQQLLGDLQQTVAIELADVGDASTTARRELRESLAAHWSAADLPPDELTQAQQLALQAVDTGGAATQAELLARVNDRVGSLQPCLEPHCSPARPMWYVMLGLDRGWRTAAIAALLLLYNIGRFVITRAVGDMRDNEERTGWCPALSEYGPYNVAHKVMTGLFVVAVLGAAMEIGLFLFLDFVYLPL